MDDALNPATRGHVRSWTAIALGPLCWFGDLVASDALQPIACTRVPRLLPLVALGFSVPLIIAALAAFSAWRSARPRAARSEFVTTLGLVMPMIFLVALSWSGLATAIFAPCER
jgi:hypothetical protein